MQLKFILPIPMLAVLFLLQSCSKDSQSEMVLTAPTPQVINATVASNSTYELNLEKYGTVKIYRQASHFLYSSAGIDSKSGLMVYKYVPAAEFNGDDEVVLSSVKTYVTTSTNSGCNQGEKNNSYTATNMNTSTSYITVKFKVVK